MAAGDQGARKSVRTAQRRERRAELHRRRRVRRSSLWRRRRLIYVLGLLGLTFVSGAGLTLSRLPIPAEAVPAQTSWICFDDVEAPCGPDNAIASMAAEENRQLVDLADIPEVLTDAVIAAEDRDFRSHQGLDPTGIARAAWYDLNGSGSLQGGSTITQQYVKNVYLNPERTVARKLREAVLAVKIERRFTKDEILSRYLNQIYFGRGAYGVQAASLAYFGKNVGDLGLVEAAYLAGLIRSPSTADGAIDPDEAGFRRRSVLDAMLEEGMITAVEADQADAVPFEEPYLLDRAPRSDLDLRQAGRECGMEYVLSWVRQELAELFGARIYTAGLRVYLTIDRTKQCSAWNVLNEALPDPNIDPDAALVALDADRDVVALVGGRDYSESQVNLALGRAGGGSGRQAGSGFKPIVLLAAIQQGISARSQFAAPAKIVIPEANNGEDWSVEGGASPDGDFTLAEAMEVSSNTVYAQLIVQVGAAEVVELAGELGVSSPLDPIAALAFGASDVSVLDMASAYSTFANAGETRPPSVLARVELADGSDQALPERSVEQVMSLSEAGQVTATLVDVVERGTGVRAQFGGPAAGKTGTTDDLRDAWFVGYSCDLTVAVWMGYSGRDGQPVRSMLDVRGEPEVTGGTIPSDMWSRFMSESSESEAGCLYTDRSFPGIELSPDPDVEVTQSDPNGSSQEPDLGVPGDSDTGSQTGDAATQTPSARDESQSPTPAPTGSSPPTVPTPWTAPPASATSSTTTAPAPTTAAPAPTAAVPGTATSAPTANAAAPAGGG